MAFKCPLDPPHMDPATGEPMIHKNRRECRRMSRSVEEPRRPMAVSPHETAQEEATGQPSPPIPETAPEEARKPVGDHPPKKKPRLFAVVRRNADTVPESTSLLEAPKAAEPTWEATKEMTVSFVSTILSLLEELFRRGDEFFKPEKKFDYDLFRVYGTTERLIGENMRGMVTRILKALGAKTLAEAERMVNGLVLVRVFGILAIHMTTHALFQWTRGETVKMWKERARERKEKKALEAAAKSLPEPPKEST